MVTVRQPLVERTARLVLAGYLLALLLTAIAAGAGRIELTLFAWAWLAVPVIAFGQSVWTAARARRATDPARAADLSLQAAIQLIIGLLLLGSFLYNWYRAPQAFLNWW
ncbi:hypothetical protein [Actinoplanes sp. L3-i22]|uniref:hypothetical protein n=1 Tax=Actinoplanes sp. L3-i22 TaxID=2836373 RepID=UPI001C781A1C|nr:hypothetical protein [Actinoplanes sp. L3-i22]BCY10527.1 hypothetical protein L3i22_056150 [Actinoplanes sp. L3-i22]